VCLQASEEEINDICVQYFYEVGDMYRGFRDEDIGDMLTAVAFMPMSKAEGDRYFGHLRLA